MQISEQFWALALGLLHLDEQVVLGASLLCVSNKWLNCRVINEQFELHCLYSPAKMKQPEGRS